MPSYLDQIVNPQYPESHFPNYKNGQIIGIVPAIVTSTEDPEGLGRIRLKFPIFDNNKELSNVSGGYCIVGERFTVNERPGGSHTPIEVGTEVLVAPILGDLRESVLIACAPNRHDRPYPDFDRSKGRYGSATRNDYVEAHDDMEHVSIRSHPNGVVESVSGDGDYQIETAAGARHQITHDGDARLEGSAGQFQTLASGEMAISNAAGAAIGFDPKGQLASKNAFGGKLSLERDRGTLSGPLSEVVDLALKPRRLMGELADAYSILQWLQRQMEKLEWAEDPQAALESFCLQARDDLEDLEGSLVASYPEAIGALRQLLAMTPDRLGHTIAEQVGTAYDFDIAGVLGEIDALLERDRAPILQGLREDLSVKLEQKSRKVLDFFPSKLKKFLGNTFLGEISAELIEEAIARILKGTSLDEDIETIAALLKGESDRDEIMSQVELVRRQETGWEPIAKGLGRALVPIAKVAFGIELELDDDRLSVESLLDRLKAVAEDLAPAVGLDREELDDLLDRGTAVGALRAHLKKVFPESLFESGVFPSDEVCRRLSLDLKNLEHDREMQRRILLAEVIPFEKFKNAIDLHLYETLPQPDVPWAIVRPGEIDALEVKREAIVRFGEKQRERCDLALAALESCREIVETVPNVREIFASFEDRLPEHRNWAFAQLESGGILDRVVETDTIFAAVRDALVPLLERRDRLKAAFEALRDFAIVVPEDFVPGAALEFKDAAGAIVASGANSGGRVEVSAAGSAMFAPGDRSAIFAQPKDLGLKIGAQNALNIHDDPKGESFTSLLNKGRIALRNATKGEKTSGILLDLAGQLKLASFPEDVSEFDWHGSCGDWAGETSLLNLADKAAKLNTKANEIVQTALDMSVGKLGGLSDLAVLSDGIPQSALKLASTPLGGSTFLQSLSGGIPQVSLDLQSIAGLGRVSLGSMAGGMNCAGLDLYSFGGAIGMASLKTFVGGVQACAFNLGQGFGFLRSGGDSGSQESNINFERTVKIENKKHGERETVFDLSGNRAVSRTFRSGKPLSTIGCMGGGAVIQGFPPPPKGLPLTLEQMERLITKPRNGVTPEFAMAVFNGRLLMKSLSGSTLQLDDRFKVNGIDVLEMLFEGRDELQEVLERLAAIENKVTAIEASLAAVRSLVENAQELVATVEQLSDSVARLTRRVEILES
jgi:hypothetical protein